YGGDAGRAQKTFEDWCRRSPEGEGPVQTDIKKIVGAELIEQLLTESGGQQLDWSRISESLMEPVSAIETEAEAPTAPGDFGEGYWVDVNQTVPLESVGLDIELL